MTANQLLLAGLLAVSFGLFAWGRWRYDAVAMALLVVAVGLGLVPAARAFDGFANPAVITVALVLVLSRGLLASGLVDLLAARLTKAAGSATTMIFIIGIIVATVSAFMNNVGALAFFLPIALTALRSSSVPPAQVLMPISFATMLGGMTTLIGTPPNIIVSGLREEELGAPFGMFDFAFAGLPVAVLGIFFLSTVGWRLLPKERRGSASIDEMIDVKKYVTEIRVGKGAKWIGQTLLDIERETNQELQVVGLVRGETRSFVPNPFSFVQQDDVLVVEASPEFLKSRSADPALELEADEWLDRKALENDEVIVTEVVVLPNSRTVGATPQTLLMRTLHNLNVLGVARGREAHHTRLQSFAFAPGDVVLLQGGRKQIADAVAELGFAPLAERSLQMLRRRSPLLALGIFVVAIVAAASEIVSPAIAFAAAVVLFLAARILRADEAYRALEPSVLVLLGALIPIAQAFADTGLAALVGTTITGSLAQDNVTIALAITLVITMTLSDIVNNAATAAVMAPIAISAAHGLGANPDGFLIAVAIGASCAFLTPIGHQNNLLIMKPGGYRFGDYWRMGLPLEILVAVTAVWAIDRFWLS
jgi:di/tricarboxylate transporter